MVATAVHGAAADDRRDRETADDRFETVPDHRDRATADDRFEAVPDRRDREMVGDRLEAADDLRRRAARAAVDGQGRQRAARSHRVGLLAPDAAWADVRRRV